MLTYFLAALKSGVPIETTQVVAAFESILRRQVNDGMDSADNEREEAPRAAWTTVEKPTTEREDLRRDSAVDVAAAEGIRHEMRDVVYKPFAKRSMSSICLCHSQHHVSRQSTADRTVGLICTGRMTALEAQFSAAGFYVVAVQEGRMPSRTVLSGNTYRMHVLEGVGITHSLGLQMRVHKSLTAALGHHSCLTACHVPQQDARQM